MMEDAAMTFEREPASRSIARASTERKGHVLFLDDEKMVVTVAVRLLRKLGFTAEGFTRAELALDAVRAAPHAFDFVVTDWHLRSTNGLEVAAALRALRADLPVGLVCSQSPTCSSEELARGGVRAAMQKPFGLSQLSDLLARLARR